MMKAATKHRRIRHTHKKPLSDLDKIKAFLWDTTQNAKNGASETFNNSFDLIKDKSELVGEYLGERPLKSVSFSMLAGLALGVIIGYFFRH